VGKGGSQTCNREKPHPERKKKALSKNISLGAKKSKVPKKERGEMSTIGKKVLHGNAGAPAKKKYPPRKKFGGGKGGRIRKKGSL